MGNRGPARKPTKVLELTNPAKAAARKGEPKPGPGMPECPEWLTDDARPVWFRVCGHLRGMGLLHGCDEHAIARYAQMFAYWVRAAQQIARWADWETQIPEDADAKTLVQIMEGLDKKYKRLGALNDKLRMLEQQFGLTPAARANLAVEKSDEDENRGKNRFFNAG